MSRLDGLSTTLFGALRQMDAEATTRLPTGAPTGLSDYGRHSRPELRRPQAEVEWSRRLASLLRAAGYSVTTEVRYPEYALPTKRRRQRCDLVVDLGEEGRLWLEIKGAWRDYWGGKSGIYHCYLLYPLAPEYDLGKDHTVPFDLTKLKALRTPEAQFIAELLIGFERLDDPMDHEIRRLIRLAELDQWRTDVDAWESGTTPNQRIRTWLWQCAVSAGPKT